MIGVPGMTITAIRETTPTDRVEMYRGAPVIHSLVPRIRLDIVVNDDMAETVITAVTLAVRRHEDGDGRIFVAPVEDVIRIRTGETGADALA